VSTRKVHKRFDRANSPPFWFVPPEVVTASNKKTCCTVPSFQPLPVIELVRRFGPQGGSRQHATPFFSAERWLSDRMLLVASDRRETSIQDGRKLSRSSHGVRVYAPFKVCPVKATTGVAVASNPNFASGLMPFAGWPRRLPPASARSLSSRPVASLSSSSAHFRRRCRSTSWVTAAP
jgi:hypothetical protein